MQVTAPDARGHVASYYAATANDATRYRPLEGRVETDICVVGGGYAGLAAALELRQRGYGVVLLEGRRIGWGASGRNGGQVVTGYACGMTKIERWLGRDDARRLWDMGLEAKSILADRIARHAIACDWKPGYLFAAVKPRQIAELEAEYEQWHGEYDYSHLRLLDEEAVRAEVATDAYRGGLYDAGSGHLHPLNLALGLARAAAAEGVAVHEDSPVVALDEGARPRVRTRSGEVACDHVVLCGNAYLGDLVPAIRAKIMPVSTYLIATEPLGEARARALVPNDIAVCDVNFVLDYFRLSADRRLLFGGRVSYTATTPRDLAASMRRSMLKVFPQLADVGIDHAWGGNVAITVERSPHFGRLGTNIWFTHGFSGHGVALTHLAGRLVAEAVAGSSERFDLFARLPHRTFVGGRLFRAPMLALAMLYFRLRDRL